MPSKRGTRLAKLGSSYRLWNGSLRSLFLEFTRFNQDVSLQPALILCLPAAFRTFGIANVVHFGETTKHLAEKMFSVTYHGLLVRLSRANKQKMRETGKCGNRFLGRKRCFPCYSVVYDGIGHG